MARTRVTWPRNERASNGDSGQSRAFCARLTLGAGTVREHVGVMAKTLEELKVLRDEIKLKLHLATMDAKDEWKQLEPKLVALEHKIDREGEKAVEAAGEVFTELGAAFRKFKDKLIA